jgi:hypothetical protein
VTSPGFETGNLKKLDQDRSLLKMKSASFDFANRDEYDRRYPIFPTDQFKRKVLTGNLSTSSFRPARDFSQCP